MTSELKISAKSGGTMSWVPPFTREREAGTRRPGPTSALERLLMSSGAGQRTNHKPNKPNKPNTHSKVTAALETMSQRAFSNALSIPPPDFSRWRRNHPKHGWSTGKCSQVSRHPEVNI